MSSMLSKTNILSRASLRFLVPRSVVRQGITRSLPSQTTYIYRSYTQQQAPPRMNSQEKIPKFDISKLSKAEIQRLRDFKHQEDTKMKNRTIALYFSSMAVLFLGLSYAAVPIYRALCARTGFGGIPITDRRKFTDDKLIPVDTEKRIKISFTSEVSQILPWKFVPQQREVYVLPGETALAFYKAKNHSDKDIIGMATYSISPGEAAQYFNKIQCFCFEEQKLAAGEEIDMPVFFFIDPDFASDPAMRNIDDIILHYTFFKAHYGDGSAVSDAAATVAPGSVLVKNPDDDDE
ncbi:hypothetical protein NCAS_0C01520 [Naumovozyma castellii]|uniref:Cytochrome c oxidase assembly protein CtaG/Cox11 n=1 Tax=Naumovozyma castellii TaxID=27288 RepID=G0VCD3_NAUCA|nr:hypothetical protein NCAS_0C01520 [Naumovozyma castellii CBS 4309]CCC69142.1 hypothetical protein NCAS_0C01520 [Naumovozyma castellii CBS 4309]